MKPQETALQRKTFFPKHGLCVIPCLFLPLSALAEVDYFELTLEQLLETQVLSVSKRAETIANAPAAIYVVTSEEIRRSGVTTIPDALRMVPGVNVARADSNSWAISIRGFNSTLANKLLVLIDGRTIYNPVFGGVLWEAHDLMLEDIERIEVVRGPGGTLWGANAVNGVINIITKHTRDTKGNLVSASAGDEEKGTFSARHGGSFGEDGSYRVYAKGFERDNSLKPTGGDAYDSWNGIRTGFRADWSDKFTLQGDAYKTETEQRRIHYSLVAPYQPIENQTITYEGVNLLGRWADKYEDGSQLSVQTYIDWARRDEPINFIDNRTIYDLEVQYNFAQININDITVGAGLRYLSDNEIGDINTSFSPQRRRDNIYSAFVQDKITLVDKKLFLTLGSKFEHNEFSGAESQPNIRLQWQLTQDQTLWAAASKAVRTPTPVEEDLTTTIATAANIKAGFVPNNAFQAERLKAYEIGYRNQITPTLSADITAFKNVYDNLQTFTFQPLEIVTSGPNSPYIFIPAKFTNDMDGKSHGVEAVINWMISPTVKVAIDYSYLNLTVNAVDPTQEMAEKLYPENQAGVRVFWTVSQNWTLDTSVSYVDNLVESNVDDYVRLDINLGGQITKALRFNVVGQNLLDAAHREFLPVNDINAAEIERSVFGKLTWIF